MATFDKSQRREILQNPLAAYKKFEQNPSDKNIDAISLLGENLQKYKSEQKQAQKNCQKISRQIGQARRENNTVDELMVSMQTQSKKLKAIKDNFIQCEKDILVFFEPPPESTTANTTLAEKNLRHTEIDYDLDTVSVTLFNDEQDEWNNYVNRHTSASIYHRAEWQQLIRQAHKQKGLYFIARNNSNNIVGILPLTHMQSRLFGNFMVSMPYFNYGGAIADHALIEQQLMSTAASHADKLGISHIEFRDDISRDDYPARTDKVNMLLQLPQQHEQLWSGFSAKLRAQIKRPQRENPQIMFGGEELLDDFYSVFARNMRDLGTPVYGKIFFRKILQNFASSKIIIIRLANKPVAAAFLLGHKDTLEIPWASTIKDVNHLSMNMLMYWEVLKFAIENNYQQFDFGRSSKGAGTYRFKQQWGAKPKQLFWHYWLSKDAELPRLNPDNPKFALAINAWKRLPIFITKLIGPFIVKNLP